MKVVKHLPFLVSYYRWLHHTFNHMFTKEQAMNMSITQALETLPNPHKHYVEFGKLKKIWKECQETLLVAGCANQGADAVGAETPDLADDFLFGELVTHDISDRKEYDKLWFVLNELTSTDYILNNKTISPFLDLHQEVVQKGVRANNDLWVTFDPSTCQLRFLPNNALHLLVRFYFLYRE